MLWIGGFIMKQILVVDDNLSILKQISVFLADDYEVSLAKSGALALEICMREKPDLILLDVEMPDMDGFEVIDRIRQNPALERIPVIFLTANRDAETEVKGLEAGARDFIVKPVEKSILLHRIELHIRLAVWQSQTEQTVMNLSDSFATSFSELIECRDENTGGHVIRTSKYVEALGLDLIKNGLFPEELTEPELRMMVRAAPLHDLGKIAISDRVLLKAGMLSDAEFTLMKRHADIGGAILERMYQRIPSQRYLRYASFIAASHHERYDGKGYPRGLAGNNIPLCARIMAVADVYDALIENRVYRRGMDHIKAYNIIIEEQGSHFDPVIIESFKNIQDQIYRIAGFGGKETEHHV
jgi:putative two-component system response regulator